MSQLAETQELVGTQSMILFDDRTPFRLDSGSHLASVTVTFETYGALNQEGTNAVLICHSLTANAHAANPKGSADGNPGWWDGLIGPGKAFDTQKYFVVSPNILGSCYGTTGPVSTNTATDEPYGPDFPQITVRDIVRVQKELLDRLGVRRLAAVSGSSLGGMQVVEWGIMFPEFCERIIPISASVKQSAWCIALNGIARAAITGDPAWKQGRYSEQPAAGLSLARMLGMVSYRSPEEFRDRFGRTRQSDDRFDAANLFQVESYLHHQGKKLAERFDANTYLCLSRAMDLHDIGFGRESVEEALRIITAKTLCIGVSTDIKYPTHEQKELASLIPGARYAEIDSVHGHDAFLIEFGQLNELVKEHLKT